MKHKNLKFSRSVAKVVADLVLKRPFIFPVGIYLCLTYVQEILTSTFVRDYLLFSILVLLYRQVSNWRGISLESILLFFYGTLLSISVTWNVFGSDEFSIPGVMAIVTLGAILANHHYTEQDIDDARNMFFLGGVCTSVAMLYQNYFGDPFYMGGRLTLGNAQHWEDPNTLCAYLTMALAAGFQIILSVKTKGMRALIILATGAVLVTMLLTGSRGGFVGIGVSASLFLLTSRLERKTKVTIIFFAVLALPYLPGFSNVWERFSEDSSGSGRTYIWNIALERYKEKLFFG
ncbi:MAG: O-antigen ligase family protein, partial [Bdellovibrionales bacterium]|nr:O-antigen ligase family protein [Bdellovibrionales bacterium]